MLLPHVVGSAVVHRRDKVPSSRKHFADSFQGFLGGRNWFWLIPNSPRWPHKGIQQTRVVSQSNDILKLIGRQPTALFFKVEFFLQRIGVNNHGKSKSSYPALVVTPSAVKRMTQ